MQIPRHGVLSKHPAQPDVSLNLRREDVMLILSTSPEEGGIGIEAPIQKDKWMCALKCQPGVPSHDPLIDAAKENISAVKKDIEHQVSSPLLVFGVLPNYDTD